MPRLPIKPLRLLVALLAVVLAPVAGVAQERILDFRSDVVVEPSGALTVTETIAVIATGIDIKRGIIRDFPTTYTGRLGQTVRIGFKILGVRRDGRPEPYKTESRQNGVSIYIGDPDVFIATGRHVYTLTYRTDRQLGQFEDFDEIYWNVTGSGWSFIIERASVSVTLPPGAEVLNWAAYTGRPGEQGQDFAPAYDPSGAAIALATTRELRPGEGFTIAVAFPKVLIAEPTVVHRIGFLLGDNPVIAAGLAGLVVLLAYFLLVWTMVGRGPKKGAIVPHYEPPKGFSPAAARYVTRMGFDGTAFTAAVVNMAVKGYLTIEEDEKGDYALLQTGKPVDLTSGERALAGKLFACGRDWVQLDENNSELLQMAQKALRDSLRNDFERVYFLKNAWYFLPGLGVTLIALVAMAGFSAQPVPSGFMALALTVPTYGAYVLLCKAYDTWRLVLARSKVLFVEPAIRVTVFFLPFLGMAGFVSWKLAEFITPPGAMLLGLILLVDLLFYNVLKAPTRLGRKVMDQIEGFALYLSVAEKDRLNFHNPPQRTPELFERFLPYALALGVEQAWSEQFAGVLDAASQDPAGSSLSGRYEPTWYSGRGFDSSDIAGFSSSLGSSFAGAIAASSTPPGSSSGSGGVDFPSGGGGGLSGGSGGGFSGGGGGGGGGRGW